MTMKILSPMERQNIQRGRQALVRLPQLTKRDESAEAKPLDYVEPKSQYEIVSGAAFRPQPQNDFERQMEELNKKIYERFAVDPGHDEGTSVTHAVAKPGLASGFAISAQLEYLEAKNAKASEEYKKQILEQCEKLIGVLSNAKPRSAKLRYTGNNLEVEARIAKEMQYRDNFEKKMDEAIQSEPIFYPTSLSAFVQDHRIMRKGPWR